MQTKTKNKTYNIVNPDQVESARRKPRPILPRLWNLDLCLVLIINTSKVARSRVTSGDGWLENCSPIAADAIPSRSDSLWSTGVARRRGHEFFTAEMTGTPEVGSQKSDRSLGVFHGVRSRRRVVRSVRLSDPRSPVPVRREKPQRWECDSKSFTPKSVFRADFGPRGSARVVRRPTCEFSDGDTSKTVRVGCRRLSFTCWIGFIGNHQHGLSTQ